MTLLALVIAFGQGDGFPRRVEIDKVDAWPREGRIVVEGKYSLIGEGNDAFRPMYLLKSNVAFHVPRSLLREKAPTGNIEVTGVVESRGGKRVVQVEDFKLLPPDEKRFEEMFEAAGDDPEKYVGAAQWAVRRHDVYKSPAMAAAAKKAFDAAVERERKQAAGDPEKLADLNNRLRKDPKFVGYDFEAFNHEIVRAEFDRTPKKDGDALLKFADQILQQRLDGAKITGDAIDPRHRSAYDERPLPTYESADAALRRALERYFYSRVVARSLELSAENGAAPFDLAETAKRKVPEYQDVSRRWFRDWAKTQRGRLADLEADAAAEAARIMETELTAFAEAATFRSEWLDMRETKLRQREREARDEAKGARVQRDADAWFDLALRHLQWFKSSPEHEAKAVRILEDVLSFAPQFSKAEIELRKLGYAQGSDGAWRRKSESVDPRRPTDLRGLAVNMTPAEVLSAVGKPTHQSRTATGAGLSVVWIYRASGRETLVVFSGPPGALRVSKIRAPGE
jgi:hypothetical protein